MESDYYKNRIPEQLELPLFYTSSESPQKNYTEIPTSNVTPEEFGIRLEKAFKDIEKRLEALDRARFIDWETRHMWIGARIDQAA